MYVTIFFLTIRQTSAQYVDIQKISPTLWIMVVPQNPGLWEQEIVEKCILSWLTKTKKFKTTSTGKEALSHTADDCIEWYNFSGNKFAKTIKIVNISNILFNLSLLEIKNN